VAWLGWPHGTRLQTIPMSAGDTVGTWQSGTMAQLRGTTGGEAAGGTDRDSRRVRQRGRC
jgi:hypothetical protein